MLERRIKFSQFFPCHCETDSLNLHDVAVPELDIDYKELIEQKAAVSAII